MRRFGSTIRLAFARPAGSGNVCTGGLTLVAGGEVSISDGDKAAHTAAGLRDDGLLVHVAADSLTLTELAHVMRELGCLTAVTCYASGSENGAVLFGEGSAAPPDVAMAVPDRGRAIIGRPLADASQMEDHCHSVNPHAPYFAELYLQTGQRVGVRGDVAYAQALLQTDYFRYTGAVLFWQNNFGGLGATGPGSPGETFASAAEGILAQLQHLHAYATVRPLPSGLLLADTRYDMVTWGSAPTVDALSGRWAADTGYGARIDEILDAILRLPARTVGPRERASWFIANSRWAAAAHQARQAAGVEPVPLERKARTWSGVVVLRQPAEVRSAAFGGGLIGVLPAGSYYPSFRMTLDGAWHMITLYDGTNGWVPTHSLQRIPTPAKAPAEPTQAIVVIDPGHGGSDNGATGPTGIREKAVNLSIATLLLKRLVGAVGHVWMTRTADIDVSLGFRADLATASGGNLLLSVHNNSRASTSTGTETYYQCGCEQQQATLDDSLRLGCLVQSQVLSSLAQHNQAFGNCCPPCDRGLRCRLSDPANPRDYYYVLRNTFIPAVLLEGLFLSNPQEEACLSQPAMQETIADALFQAIIAFLHGVQGECSVRPPLFGMQN